MRMRPWDPQIMLEVSRGARPIAEGAQRGGHLFSGGGPLQGVVRSSEHFK